MARRFEIEVVLRGTWELEEEELEWLEADDMEIIDVSLPWLELVDWTIDRG